MEGEPANRHRSKLPEKFILKKGTNPRGRHLRVAKPDGKLARVLNIRGIAGM